MWWVFFLSVAFVVGIVVASILWFRKEQQEAMEESRPTAGSGIHFDRRESLLDETERTLYTQLAWAVGKESNLFVRVSLAELVEVPRSTDRRDFQMKMLRSKVVSFIMCDQERTTPVLAIHLGNPEPGNKDHQEEHTFIEAVLHGAGIPVLWLSPRQSYLPNELRALIRETLNRPYLDR